MLLRIGSLLLHQQTQPAMAFGEYWDSCEYHDGALGYNPDAHRQRLVDWCDTTEGLSAAFDFTTKGILQRCACVAACTSHWHKPHAWPT